MIKRSTCYTVAFICLFTSVCIDSRVNAQTNVPGTVKHEDAMVQTPPVMEYRIGTADVLSISVWQHDDMERTVIVRPDGMISFPLLEDIHAAGLTPAQLRETLVSKLNEYMDIGTREVSVIVEEIHSYTVSVLGEVRTPGRFEFQSHVTVLDVLAEAGGLTEFASRSGILIFRPGQGSMRRIQFNYNDIVSSKKAAEQYTVYPGDIILVP